MSKSFNKYVHKKIKLTNTYNSNKLLKKIIKNKRKGEKIFIFVDHCLDHDHRVHLSSLRPSPYVHALYSSSPKHSFIDFLFGLPTSTSIKHIDCLNDSRDVTGFIVIGDDHRPCNCRSFITCNNITPKSNDEKNICTLAVMVESISWMSPTGIRKRTRSCTSTLLCS